MDTVGHCSDLVDICQKLKMIQWTRLDICPCQHHTNDHSISNESYLIISCCQFVLLKTRGTRLPFILRKFSVIEVRPLLTEKLCHIFMLTGFLGL